MTNYNIDIVSDVVCPWCYIGHTRLSRAIINHQKTYPDDTFKLTYKPFYLAPPPQLKSNSTPPFPVASRPRQEVYAEKFGSERAQQITTMMAQVSASEGLHFKFGGKTGVSRNGHRLVHYAQNHGGEEAQNKTMVGLWRRYFEQEVDITELDVLVEIGVEAGLGRAEEVKKYLERGDDGREVDLLAEEARQKGISGVPHYEIQGTWQISGAQEPLAFETVFKRWKNMDNKEKANGAL